MGYIDRNLLTDEKIIFRTKKHLILFLYPTMIAIAAIVALYYMRMIPMLHTVAWVPVFVTALIWSYVAIEYLSADFVVTNKRIMMREGFFNRHANETRLNAISQVNIDQNPLAQLLNYGTVSINAFSVFDVFPVIAKPYEFQRAVNEQVDQFSRR